MGSRPMSALAGLSGQETKVQVVRRKTGKGTNCPSREGPYVLGHRALGIEAVRREEGRCWRARLHRMLPSA